MNGGDMLIYTMMGIVFLVVLYQVLKPVPDAVADEEVFEDDEFVFDADLFVEENEINPATCFPMYGGVDALGCAYGEGPEDFK